ncbi:hypothetical protein [Bradyrhizobium elkanii]|jgi:hypothetical protein|uniref:Uncharacterized protein n=1 Tax=Bradyrhizobium elkanii TaxID=29448 RepID=A0ABV4F0C3_BRAEL|nr:hypothetical protein [Bradyrhizobium elkanii]MCP1757903.1 hypothetical protein [Bradyrhizobium elkanii]MCS3881800.1 hypothetical protein [Bradyrhizobium elkanii]MCS4218559.1 hypothetical protein [Bradyrhizobium elkanii]MCW2110144.1 hypothetical protein [Bradyrhizobium elkanii]MCW2201488.1 hypothetical protein [Bradyrhizobium elkanii]
MAIAGRRAWAQRVIKQMIEQDVSGVRLLILASPGANRWSYP